MSPATNPPDGTDPTDPAPSDVPVADLERDRLAAKPDPRADPDNAATAAAAALARARAAAKAKGLRPGMKPKPRRRNEVAEVRRTGAGKDDRDPLAIADSLDHLLGERGWQTEVAVGSVLGRWDQIVGGDVAQHSEPVSFIDGVLTVRASSTAWATQIRYLTSQVLGRMNAELGADTVVELRVVGPATPTWRYGRRAAQGRGPRDTYG